jgi:hypothetical protein
VQSVQGGKYGGYFFSSKNQKIAMLNKSHTYQGLKYVASLLHCNG